MAAKIANDQVGKHDGVLDFFIEKHRNEPAIVVDTVLDLLSRRGLISPDDFSTGLTGVPRRLLLPPPCAFGGVAF